MNYKSSIGITTWKIQDNYLNIICKSAFYIGYVGESSSQWILVAFTAIKALAFYWPIKSHSLQSAKFASYLGSFVIIICSVICIPVAVTFGIREQGCKFIIEKPILKFLMGYFVTMQKYTYSTILMLILSSLVMGKLCRIQKSRKKLFLGKIPGRLAMPNHHVARKIPRVRIEVAISLLILVAIHSIIYLSCGVIWGGLYSGIMKDTFQKGILFRVGLIFDYCTIFSRSWNYYIYLIVIKEFREASYNMITCKGFRKIKLETMSIHNTPVIKNFFEIRKRWNG